MKSFLNKEVLHLLIISYLPHSFLLKKTMPFLHLGKSSNPDFEYLALHQLFPPTASFFGDITALLTQGEIHSTCFHYFLSWFRISYIWISTLTVSTIFERLTANYSLRNPYSHSQGILSASSWTYIFSSRSQDFMSIIQSSIFPSSSRSTSEISS